MGELLMAGKLSSKIKDAATNLRKTQVSTPAGGATEQAFTGAAAAQGKAPTGPSGQSNISEVLGVQEQRAVGEQAAQQMDQQAGQAQVQEAQQASQQKQFKSQQLAQELEGDARYNQELDNQFAHYKEHSLDMNAEEENLALEDLGAKLALKDKKYQAELSRRGDAARLQDAANFSEEVAKQVIGEDLANFRKSLEFQVEQHGLDLENMEDLSKIDIGAALSAANAAIKADLVAQESAGWSQLGSAAGSAAGSMNFGGGTTSTAVPTTAPTNVGSTGKLGGPV
jgi:hypothetical protein